MAEDSERLREPVSPEEWLTHGLKTSEALAAYARAEHLTEADELLTDPIALLVSRSALGHEGE